MIEAQNIVKTFRTGDTDFTVLKGISFTIPEKQFVSIIGRSGSGKSTLLYQLSLLDHPTDGKVIIDGLDTSTFSREQRTEFRLRKLGYIFQDYAVLPELTALENVLVPLLMQGINYTAATKKATEALEKVDLGHRLNNLPSQMSGGEQQRVSIARAIGHDPKILFADEPTANLDNETSKIILNIFLDLHRAGQTIVMVTHEPEYAALTERIITLSDGKIIDDSRNQPDTRPLEGECVPHANLSRQ